MEQELNDIRADLKRLMVDVAMMKSILIPIEKDPEGELSDWAKEELEKARAEPEESYTSLTDLRKEIENEL